MGSEAVMSRLDPIALYLAERRSITVLSARSALLGSNEKLENILRGEKHNRGRLLSSHQEDGP